MSDKTAPAPSGAESDALRRFTNSLNAPPAERRQACQTQLHVTDDIFDYRPELADEYYDD